MPTDEILDLLVAERDKLNRAIEALGGGAGTRPAQAPTEAVTPPAKPKRRLSAAGRRAIIAAAKKRWALIRAGKLPSPLANRAKRKAV
jgi:hypothetical protein